MSVTYSMTAINNRLNGVVDAIDGGGGNGYMYLRDGSTVLASIQLARPMGVVDSGVLTFSGTLLDDSADATGYADNAIITDSAGASQVTGLTVGIPLSGLDIVISNGLNSTLITAGQTVAVLSAQITGS